MIRPLLSIEAFILAGGRSSRFGSNKALAVREGRTLLEHALRAVAPLRLPTRVVTRDPAPYLPWAVAFVLSERPDLGPAEALRAALLASLAPWALVLTVDMPHAAPLLKPLILAASSVEQDVNVICYADAGARVQPFPGLYRRDLAARIAELGPGASMQGLLAVARVHALAPPDVPGATDPNAPFHNVNEPRDLP